MPEETHTRSSLRGQYTGTVRVRSNRQIEVFVSAYLSSKAFSNNRNRGRPGIRHKYVPASPLLYCFTIGRARRGKIHDEPDFSPLFFFLSRSFKPRAHRPAINYESCERRARAVRVFIRRNSHTRVTLNEFHDREMRRYELDLDQRRIVQVFPHSVIEIYPVYIAGHIPALAELLPGNLDNRKQINCLLVSNTCLCIRIFPCIRIFFSIRGYEFQTTKSTQPGVS